MLRRTALTLGSVAVVLLGLGCATLFDGGPRSSREEALADCTASVPAETVPYADRFAACMEGHGWVYRSGGS